MITRRQYYNQARPLRLGTRKTMHSQVFVGKLSQKRRETACQTKFRKKTFPHNCCTYEEHGTHDESKIIQEVRDKPRARKSCRHWWKWKLDLADENGTESPEQKTTQKNSQKNIWKSFTLTQTAENGMNFQRLNTLSACVATTISGNGSNRFPKMKNGKSDPHI